MKNREDNVELKRKTQEILKNRKAAKKQKDGKNQKKKRKKSRIKSKIKYRKKKWKKKNLQKATKG